VALPVRAADLKVGPPNDRAAAVAVPFPAVGVSWLILPILYAVVVRACL